jgi:PIN domain nuclease of toxin-antitoxin system
MAIVADTHTIIWYVFEPERLSQVALDALEGAIAVGDPVYISAISLIEICYLIEKRRIASDLLQRILAVLNEPDPSLIVVPIDLAISIAVQNIARDPRYARPNYCRNRLTFELTTGNSRPKDSSIAVNYYNLVKMPR